MKIKITTIENYEYDEKKELDRLHACFEGEILDRQLKIFNHFLNGENDELKDAYYDLPYDEEEECSEMEYVGMWMTIISGGWGGGEYLIDKDCVIELPQS